MNRATNFDVIVIGGGHSGIEAAYAAARMGSRTLLITLDFEKIGWMPCNPAIGGIGKGHIVFEISALGGLMPKLCTKTYLQARMLNTKKGPAVQGLRLQIDKEMYRLESRKALESTKNLSFYAGMVEKFVINNQSIQGVILADGAQFLAPCVVLTTGTFLDGKVHVGSDNWSAGRFGEESVISLSLLLKQLDVKMGRLKTGTPPRLLKDSLDFSRMAVQEPDNLKYLFEFNPHTVRNTHPCYITHTNQKTHEIIRNNVHHSPMYLGHVTGKSPRYCPSIEDKVARFPDKTGHHVFVEPESASTDEIYPNGISTSLPLSIQTEFIRTIPGFENAIITKSGYAVEYDYVCPSQLFHTLETKFMRGLFLAGQINGTTGYEEAAGQGIIAGINAHQKAHGLSPFILSRDEGYIGVMIDDLVTLGVDEPYRMFTSRAERRLLLRQDNVFYRFADKSYNLGLINKELYENIKEEQRIIYDVIKELKSTKNSEELLHLLGRDTVNISRLHELSKFRLNDRSVLSLWAEIRYEPYLKRELKQVEKNKKYQELKIPDTFEYENLPGLSKELQEKLIHYKPTSIAQAKIVPGITPAAISLLIFKVQEVESQKRKKI